jgi:biopolymer transport protein TolR
MRARRKPVVVQLQRSTKNDINVTPLVDVVLVLLIIFMVVMPLLESTIAVRIPTHQDVSTTSEVPPDQVVVKVTRAGTLAINGADTQLEAYVAALAELLSLRASTDRVVFVTPDEEAPYKMFVQALEGARLAGAETIGMVATPVEPVALAPGD